MEEKEKPMRQDLWSLGRVLSRMYRQTQMWMDKAFEPLGLGRGLYQYLVEVARSPGANQMELAGRLAVDEASVTRGIRRLAELGYVKRRRDEEDRRMWRIDLSPEGEKVLPRLEEEFRRWNRAATLGASEEEIARQIAFFRRSMEEVARQMDAKELADCERSHA
ncbi:MAG TPA: MarR family transcriptional regulator [Synergistaceae bacterium]|nr:MarR family transcriptional regulator [Synergistaceae bacterium]HPJ25644.1 MarR family transcriptional regulator [Synergistaceae bacterium]HPQ38433.1 MarR family transcriptional regulator [Synergistaceae bacterium]